MINKDQNHSSGDSANPRQPVGSVEQGVRPDVSGEQASQPSATKKPSQSEDSGDPLSQLGAPANSDLIVNAVQQEELGYSADGSIHNLALALRNAYRVTRGDRFAIDANFGGAISFDVYDANAGTMFVPLANDKLIIYTHHPAPGIFERAKLWGSPVKKDHLRLANPELNADTDPLGDPAWSPFIQYYLPALEVREEMRQAAIADFDREVYDELVQYYIDTPPENLGKPFIPVAPEDRQRELNKYLDKKAKSWKSVYIESMIDAHFVTMFPSQEKRDIAEQVGLLVGHTEPADGRLIEKSQNIQSKRFFRISSASTDETYSEKDIKKLKEVEISKLRAAAEEVDSSEDKASAVKVKKNSDLDLDSAQIEIPPLKKYGFKVLPGMSFDSKKSFLQVLRQYRKKSMFEKHPFGSGGDFVHNIDELTARSSREALSKIVESMLSVRTGSGAIADLLNIHEDPFDAIDSLTAEFPHMTPFVELNAKELSPTSEILFNGCFFGILTKPEKFGGAPSLVVTDYFRQASNKKGMNVGSTTYDMPEKYKGLLMEQIDEYARYLYEQGGIAGLVGADIIIIRGKEGKPELYFLEPIARPGTSIIAQMIANTFCADLVAEGRKIYMKQFNITFPSIVTSLDDIDQMYEANGGYNPAKIKFDDPRYDPTQGMVWPLKFYSYFRESDEGNIRVNPFIQSSKVKMMFIVPEANSFIDCQEKVELAQNYLYRKAKEFKWQRRGKMDSWRNA